MENALNSFVIDFLEYPKTFIKFNRKSNIDGFALKNEDLNLQLNIFSDKKNRIYFELYYDEPFRTKANLSYPTYKADNLDEYRPLLDKLLESSDSKKMDNYTPEYKKFREELFSLHRKALKDEKLPVGYEFPKGHKTDILNSHMIICKNNQIFSSISRDSMFDSLSILQKHSDPLTFILIDFDLFESHTMNDKFVYVPYYDLQSYPLVSMVNNLEPKISQPTKINIKHHKKVTSSLHDWFKKILEKPEIQESPLHKIILKNYLLIDLNNENVEKQQKFKL